MKKLLSVTLGVALTLVISQAHALELEKKTDGLVVKLSLKGNPVHPGMNHARVIVLDETGKPITNARVTLYYGMMAMAGMPPMNYKARLKSDAGAYASQVELKMTGRWKLKVKVKSADGKSHTAKLAVTVK